MAVATNMWRWKVERGLLARLEPKWKARAHLRHFVRRTIPAFAEKPLLGGDVKLKILLKI